MPGIDGLKFLAMLQSREDLRDKPVIMLTSHGDLNTKVRGLESGASDYITKPFEPEEMVARIRVHMQIKTLQDELRRSNQLLLELAQTDPLTRLCNRRHLYEKLEIELNRCFRGTNPIALIMADIDHFKRVNDQFGHQVGDEVLTMVADLLQEELRTYDLAARYGGEEFCLVLPETDLEAASEVAERIRQRTEGLVFNTPMENHKLTISFGVAAYDGTVEGSIDEIIRIADDALYEAKKLGRNQVVEREIIS
jgi:diguanylate cyclase (GGDEF)-like protein